MDDVLETATRCPHCRASVRPGAPWCTLCHADLRPAPEPVAAAPVLPPQPGPDAPVASDPTWPCSTCGARNALAADACAACGAGFLAGLREAEGPLLELPGVGDISRLSRAQRIGGAFGVMLAFVLLTLALGLAFG